MRLGGATPGPVSPNASGEVLLAGKAKDAGCW